MYKDIESASLHTRHSWLVVFLICNLFLFVAKLLRERAAVLGSWIHISLHDTVAACCYSARFLDIKNAINHSYTHKLV